MRRTVGCWLLGLMAVVALGVPASAQEKPSSFTPEDARSVISLVRQCLAQGAPAAYPVARSLHVKTPGRLFVSAFKSGARVATVTADPASGAGLGESAIEAAKQLVKPLGGEGQAAAAINTTLLSVEIATGTREVKLVLSKPVGALVDVGNEGLAITAGAETRYFCPLAVLANAGSPSFLESLYKEVAETPPDLTAAGVRMEAFTTQAYVEQAPGGELAAFAMGNVAVASVNTDTARRAILTGGAWIMAMRGSDGLFMERYDPVSLRRLPGADAVVQLNAARMLYLLYVAVFDPEVRDAADKTVAIYKKRVLEGEGTAPFSFVKSGNVAELGPSVALLQALCDRAGATEKMEDRGLMERLGRFIIHMTNRDGAMHVWLKKQAANEPPPASTDGTAEEAILALCNLYDLTPEPGNAVWRQSAELILAHEVAAVGADEIPHPRLVEASARLYAISEDKRYADQCLELAGRLEAHLYRPGKDVSPALVGGFRSEGGPWTMQTAMCIKALAAAYEVASAAKQPDRIDPQAILGSVRFLMAQQFRPENSFYLQRPDTVQGAFRAGARDLLVRIDATRCAVDALLSSLDFVAMSGAR